MVIKIYCIVQSLFCNHMYMYIIISSISSVRYCGLYY